MHRRLASTAARATKSLSHLPAPALSTSHLPQFPPKDAVGSAFFDVSSWSAVQPPPPSALHAFAHRVGLGNILSSSNKATHDELLTACTHPSFLPLWQAQNPNAKAGDKPRTNANLAALGNSLLGMFAAEYVNASYPHLPTRVLKAAVSAYVGPLTCASVAKEMGAVPLLRWNRTPETPSRTGVLHADALSSVPRALTALVYSHRSLPVARKFAHAFFLNRDVDLRAMLKFSDPKKALQDTVRKFGRERPVSRLLKETGRFSNSPVFVVGIYSGADKLGEGFGSSLKMAEFRAAEDALLRLYLTRTPPEDVKLPSSTFSADVGDVVDVFGSEVKDEVYSAPGLGEQEVMYASAGRSAIVLDEGVREGAMAL